MKVSRSGADLGFFKRGGAQIVTCGTGGVWGGCAPSEAEKNCNFQSQFAQFGAYFLPEAMRSLGGSLYHGGSNEHRTAPTQSQAPYLCKKIEPPAPPSKSARAPEQIFYPI